MSSCVAPWTQICPGALTYRRPLPSLWRKLSSTEWRKGKRKYSQIPRQSPSQIHGGLAQRCGQGASAPVRRLRAAKRDEGGVARLSSETNDWGSIRQLKVKGAQMRKILTASVI